MNVLIIGANRGIGAAIAKQLKADPQNTVIKTSRSFGRLSTLSAHVWSVHCDLTNDSSIESMAQQIQHEFSHIDWLINCGGVLHTEQYMPEKTLSQINRQQMNQNFMTNATGHLLVINALKKLIVKSDQALVCSLSARIGSIEDNHLGGWYAYRMSKAALNMGMKTTAIEWSRQHPQVKFLLLHPGTTDTELSAPFQRRLPEGQLQSTSATATMLIEQIKQSQNHSSKFPLFLDYQGKPIPW